MTLDGEGFPWKFMFRVRLNMIVAFVGGDLAQRLDQVSEVVAAEAARTALALMTGLTLEQVKDSLTEATTSSCWSLQDFFLGAYSYTKPGGVGAKARSKLRDAVVNNRIVFAGEAMRVAKDEFATAHGAWLSGEHAAIMLLGLAL
jgi:hypothetical protein